MKTLTLFVFVLSLGGQAFAKAFITRSATVKLTYSNILTGTQTVIDARPVILRYSDNDQNCLMFKDGKVSQTAQSRCGSTYFKGYSQEDYSLPIAGVDFWTTDLVPAQFAASWKRILQKSEALSFRVNRTQDSYQKQLHDSVADESFHITINLEPETSL